MIVKSFLIMSIVAVSIFFSTLVSYAEECFNSSKKLNADAQTIILKAMEMNWQVSNSASITAASIVKGKAEIYPKDNVKICFREEDDTLQIKMQSKSKNAGKAQWHKVIAKKVGNKT